MTTIMQALKRIDKPGYHFTATYGSSGTYAVGYCADPASPCHTEGHSTPEEAGQCYRRHEADHARFGESKDEKRKCKVCGEWTSKHALTEGSRVTWLCDAHHNVDGLKQAHGLTSAETTTQ